MQHCCSGTPGLLSFKISMGAAVKVHVFMSQHPACAQSEVYTHDLVHHRRSSVFVADNVICRWREPTGIYANLIMNFYEG